MTLAMAIFIHYFLTMFCLTFLMLFLAPLMWYFNFHGLIAAMDNAAFMWILTAVVLGGFAALGLTPVAERFFRKMNGYREPIRSESEFLEPIFRRVVKQCGFERSQFDLCVNDSQWPNASAMGRRTISLTKGLMKHPEDEIEAVFAHELGHMRFADSVRSGVFWMITIVSQTLVFVLKLVCGVISAIPLIGLVAIAINGFIKLITFCMTLPLIFAQRCGSRRKEYRADKFAFDNGYGQGMMNFLGRLMAFDGQAEGILAVLKRTHPVSGERVKKLEDMIHGKVDYSKISDEEYEKGV